MYLMQIIIRTCMFLLFSHPTAPLKCILKSAKLGSSTKPLTLSTAADLKKQFFTVDVVDQQSVVLIHHSEFTA